MSGSVSMIDGHIDPDKKEMTPQEAIEWLKAIEEKYIHGGDEAFDSKRKMAINAAIESLKKQIPNKPNETDAYPHRLYCPKCYFTFCFNKENLDAIKQMQMYNYCPDCGQALDWSDTE